MIYVECNACNHFVKANDEQSGQVVQCNCGNSVQLPIVNPFEHAIRERENRREIIKQRRILRQLRSSKTCAKALTVKGNSNRCDEDSSSASPPATLRKGSLITVILGIPIVLFFLPTCMSSGKSTYRVPKWDMERLKSDIEQVVSDPSESTTILVPFDGSQPLIVPAK